MRRRVAVAAASMLWMLAGADRALACPVCFSASDAPLVQANGWGIATLLVITLAVLSAFAAFFVTLWRRARLAGDMSRGALHVEPAAGGRAEC